MLRSVVEKIGAIFLKITYNKGLRTLQTKEELNALKEEVETVSRKLHELTGEELAHVTGGETSRRIRTDEPIARDVAVRAGCAIVIKKELGVAVAVDIDMARAVANGPGMK